MKPPAGRYRLTTTTPPNPSMEAVVSEDGTIVTTLDTFDYLPGDDICRARELSCAMRCTGTGTGFAFVGVTPGFPVNLVCTPVT